MKKILYDATLLILLILLCISPQFHAQENFTISYEQFELPSGLKVVLHRDTALPVITVNMAYRAGSGNEQPGKSGVANIVGNLMLQGSKHIPRSRLLKIMDECGASFGGSVDVDRTDFWSIFPNQYLETALWIESDRMGFPASTFTQTQLDSIKKELETARKRKENIPFSAATEVIYAKLYPPTHPYSWLTAGRAKDVAKLKVDNLKSFASQFIAQDNASLCIGGYFDIAEVKALVKKYFGDIPKSAIARSGLLSRFDPSLRSEKIVVEEKLESSRMFFVFHTVPSGAPEEAALNVIARMLTGDRLARLTKTLVLSDRIAFDVQAYQSSQQAAGAFWIVASCKPETNLQSVYDAVMSELDNLANIPVDDEEIVMIKNKIMMTALGPFERLGGLGGRADLLNLANLYRNNPGSCVNLINTYEKINAQAIKAAVIRYLKADRCLVLSVVPVGKANLGVSRK